jgi:hypothetical protein
MKTTIGGDRLGSGNKQTVSMRNYERSTHDLSYLWRSSMSAGTLVPFMSEVGLPGDNFDIDLDCEVLTLPTTGPLFGSFKVQLDVFSIPVRLYNGQLHMNKLGIGMNMADIYLPQLQVTAYQNGAVLNDNEQIHSSCLLSYLNIRGLGRAATTGKIQRHFNAIPFLGYWDIYKNYYANKQEEEGVMIHFAPQEPEDYQPFSAAAFLPDGTGEVDILTPQGIDLSARYVQVTLYDGAGDPSWDEVVIDKLTGDNTGQYRLHDLYKNFSSDGLTGTWSGWNNYIPGGSGQTQVPAQNITGSGSPTLSSKPSLKRFPLENIDSEREAIYINMGAGVPYVVKDTHPSPYGDVLKFDDTLELSSPQFNQEGLAIKTYQSDLFNNWISTDWIDGPNGINEITSVDTSTGAFTIDSLNLANKVYNMLNRIAISGGTYDDWLDAVYTHERAKSVESPVYHGSLIKELAFQEVISQAASEVTSTTQPLGELAGKGRLTSKHKGGKIKIKVDEPSVIMGIVSLTPRIDYSQGNKWDTNLKTMDDFHKPALDAIGYQDLITDQMAWFDTEGLTADATTEPTYKSAGKQPAWINYMTNVNQVRGTFAERNNQMFMVLNRRYDITNEGIGDLTTYIDPSKFNHIFADARLDAQNFWVQIKNDITARRKMSAKVIPNL